VLTGLAVKKWGTLKLKVIKSLRRSTVFGLVTLDVLKSAISRNVSISRGNVSVRGIPLPVSKENKNPFPE